MAIQPKKKAVIKKGIGFAYIESTFKAEHKQKNFYVVDDPQELLALIKPYDFMGRKIITFDTETHPHYANSHLVPPGIVRRWVGSGKTAKPQDFPFCISTCDGTNAYTIFDTVANGFSKFKQLAPLFEDPTIEKIAHNWKFDAHMFANADLSIVGKVHDTVVLAKLADENRTSFQLRDLAARHPNGIVKFEYMVDNYKMVNKVTDYRQIPLELISEYANADVWNCFWVFIEEYKKLLEDELEALYENELELMIALYAMERKGMPTDADYEPIVKENLQKVTDEAESSIYKQAGRMFNINSTKQLYDVLIEQGVTPDLVKKTEKGNPSLDADALEFLANNHGITIVKSILEFRKNEKLLNTYAVGMYEQVDSEGYMHCSINQTEATTGRMSITKPALQTLPKKDKRIRTMVIPEIDYELWFMDLDQVEYRLFAHYAQAKDLLEAITKGHDVHQATAALIFQAEYEDITDDQRSSAKTTNFALVYGQGNEHTAQMLNMSVSQAMAFKSNYFAQIPEALPFIRTVHKVIQVRGFVKNMYGRRRRLGSNDAYKAPNALIQGCAADYIKHKLVDIYKYLMYYGLSSYMALIVHDELLFQMNQAEKAHLPQLRWMLSDFEKFRCPITAGCDRGDPSWGAKVSAPEIGFEEPQDKTYLSYNVFDGSIFKIGKKEATCA